MTGDTKFCVFTEVCMFRVKYKDEITAGIAPVVVRQACVPHNLLPINPHACTFFWHLSTRVRHIQTRSLSGFCGEKMILPSYEQHATYKMAIITITLSSNS